jgi:hypothetical protein
MEPYQTGKADDSLKKTSAHPAIRVSRWMAICCTAFLHAASFDQKDSGGGPRLPVSLMAAMISLSADHIGLPH